MSLERSWILAGALLLLYGGMLPAYATAGGPDFFNVANVALTDVLHLRTKPSRKARIVKDIPPTARHIRNLGCVDVVGGRVRPLGDRKQGELWCKVEFDGARGWAHGRFLVEE